MGHVNNAVFLTYFEAARMAYWMHVTGRRDLKDMDMILARAEVDFRSPLVAPESVEVGVGCASIGRTSFVLEQDMHERKTGRLVAEARKVLVYYDYGAGHPIPIDEELRRKILAQDPGAKHT
jgi:acyl-CoA thioester hydrolase